MDQNRCILCRRCVRACAELTGAFTLGFEERGARSALVADYGLPLGESTCLSCGMCVQVCPTGALVDKRSAYLGQKSVLEHNQTICLECSMGCGIDVLSRNDQVVRIEGNWEAPVNDGVLCVNGRYLSLDDNRDRLQSPLVRKDGQLVPVSWDEALDAAAAGLKPLIGKNGSGVAAAASTRLTAESLYLFKELFAGKMGSALVTSTEQGAATAAAARLAESLGKPFEAKFDALKNADCIVLVGAELNEQNPVAGLITRRLRATGAKLVIIDQGDNSLSELADSALLVKEGSLSDLIAGLTAAVVKQGLSRLETALDGRKALSAATVKTGISADAFLTTARMIAGASQPVIVFGQNLAEPAVLLDLAAATSAGIVSLKGGANSLAASQLGLDQPFTVNGQQAVYLALGDEDPTESLVKSLAAAPFLVVQASHKSALTEKADVVLPVEAWVERQGSFFSADGRLQQAVSSVSLPEAARDSQAVLVELAARMDIPLDAGGWQEAFNRRISPVTIY
jgi:formate dehydrogenase major subunit